jgi:hypothetical protein
MFFIVFQLESREKVITIISTFWIRNRVDHSYCGSVPEVPEFIAGCGCTQDAGPSSPCLTFTGEKPGWLRSRTNDRVDKGGKSDSIVMMTTTMTIRSRYQRTRECSKLPFSI